MTKFEFTDKLLNRHIGPREDHIAEMLRDLDVNSVDELIDKTIPKEIRLKENLNLDVPENEFEFINDLKEIANKNKVFDSYIGMGYYPTITPAVIQRNILENPGWYTQYTPYQAEISQGRLEALLNFQTAIIDLTGLPIANASLLDEGTAAAEAMGMFYSSRKGSKKSANKFFVDKSVFPQTIDILKTRAIPIGIELVIEDFKNIKLDDTYFGLLVQYPNANGEIVDYREFFSEAIANNIFITVSADLLSLAILTPPGEFGADAVVGSTQRFGVPMGYGGPHAAFFSTKEEFKRQIPGRIIGVSVDANGNRALRMALQTREQHIKREKATSNICTAQVLLAIMAGMYAVYHGPDGLRNIAKRIHNLTKLLESALNELGYKQANKNYFDTLEFKIDDQNELATIRKYSEEANINLNYLVEGTIRISVHEKTTLNDLMKIVGIFEKIKNSKINDDTWKVLFDKVELDLPDFLIRKSEFLNHPVFNSYHSETEMLRYIKRLEKKDISLTTSMIPLGSCTMKLNASSEMLGITWPEFSSIHPFAPADQVEGYTELISKLEKQLAVITGLPAISLQPNSGAQGEFTGLMVIRAYQKSIGEGNRNIVLIPSSAHGTNPASAVMAGGKVIVVRCDEKGNIDVDDLKMKAEENKENLSSLMVTYPSTHGVFEESIKEICSIIHANGGLVYMDGANMNAQVGLTSPESIGADVCHLNLHKTFTIPHGGGGPGVGPIAVNQKLADFLPGHSIIDINRKNSIHSVSAAPWGSASILPISYAYIQMMGEAGLRKATEVAILNANYIMAKLKDHYKALYKGVNGFVAHELIFDLREFKHSANVEVEDISKRLADYSFHAPTVSFPVPGTIMVEPTESESKEELDRFCEAMIEIRKEIAEIENGIADKENNLLKNSPHTAATMIDDNWNKPYSRERAAFPLPWVKERKFWLPVGRVDNAYGDRNLVCSCLPISDYEE
ncbi:MAG: aminomethyl-transferring glycine dehydrogenase [Melioribacteraceae bacterium]|nr:aminomethyl-transferring glycine dehydrogenase [Melioribacteraceae bacterium]MCF8352834.1 aminomethyl-transferring glycine dehydrogenase [Melioribacteraceae bacterium]MCF8393446.1 aminomethyl-transferring glycine dehydrogenase [Melioribacteraceae bacterium]MCF8417351.1 aminomethyl-transferring glycine dehydrogenase [Melioribacteraceae bacterium]